MRWDVEGANESDGQEAKLAVEAATEEEALRQARKQGILVSAIKPSPPRDGWEGLSQTLANAAEREHRDPQTKPPLAAQPVAVPEYKEIVTGADTMNMVGKLAIVVSLALFVCALIAFAAVERETESTGAAVASAGAVGITALGLLISGIFLRMNASLAIAVRDIARNSFRH